MKKLLLLSFCLFFNLLLKAQDEKLSSSSPDAVKWYNQALIQVNIQDFPGAKALLKKAIAVDKRFAEAYQIMGDIDRTQRNFPEAETSYLSVIRLNPPFVATTYYGLGFVQFNLMKYTQAQQNLQNYLNSGHGSEKTIAQSQRLVENCKFSILAMSYPKPFNPINLGQQVNTESDEYLPTVTVDDSTMIFTRRQKNNEDFYLSNMGDGGWRKARPLDESINTPEYNEGAGSISADGKTLYFTLCGRPGVMGRCDIYVSQREGYRWTEPKNLGPEVNTQGWESQPSISADGRTLYFTSSRPGGYGGFDIWKTEKIGNGHWRRPENLGPTINTADNEISPFIHADGETLYFSSDGWPGLGGKDLYYAHKDALGKWEKPINLGYPINTASDESTLVVSADGKKGYFASNNLKGFGGFDLYSFDLYQEARPREVTFIKGGVFDALSKQKLDANVEVIRLKDGRVVYSSTSDKISGEFLAGLPTGSDYAFHVSKKGYIFFSGNFSLKKVDTGFTNVVDIPLRGITNGATDILKNVFFETDSYILKSESKIELDRLIQFLKLNPGIHIEISGHTDNQGSDSHNLALSQNRSKSVITYLITYGKFDPARFTAKGYGKTQPLASNQTESGRAINRRTEFKITSIEK